MKLYNCAIITLVMIALISIAIASNVVFQSAVMTSIVTAMWLLSIVSLFIMRLNYNEKRQKNNRVKLKLGANEDVIIDIDNYETLINNVKTYIEHDRIIDYSDLVKVYNEIKSFDINWAIQTLIGNDDFKSTLNGELISVSQITTDCIYYKNGALVVTFDIESENIPWGITVTYKKNEIMDFELFH